jgi:anthranilate synthase/aminodeoxychorismate synthase-like glutamine amidotransferase
MITIIDNYDSFVYNLVQYLGELGVEVCVYRNDQISVAQIKKDNPSAIVLSPGPCTPNESGICLELAKTMAGKIPIIGVCLGHQIIASAFGGKVNRSQQVIHGKTSQIYHHNKTIYSGMNNPFEATRYHSLVVDSKDLPQCFEISAWTHDGTIMGITHKSYPIEGMQFHPESILTIHGKNLLKNFLKLCHI